MDLTLTIKDDKLEKLVGGHSKREVKINLELPNLSIGKQLNLRNIKEFIFNFLSKFLSSWIELVLNSQKLSCPNCGHQNFHPTGEKSHWCPDTSLGGLSIPISRIKCDRCGSRIWNTNGLDIKSKSLDLEELEAELDVICCSFGEASSFLKKIHEY